MSGSDVLLAVVGFAVLTALLTAVAHRQQRSSWTGVVLSKRHDAASGDDESAGTDRFAVVFRTDAGKTVTVPVTEREYEAFAVGDRAEKQKGHSTVTRVT